MAGFVRNWIRKGVGAAQLRENLLQLERRVPDLGPPGRVVVFDDFLGEIEPRWNTVSGADGSNPTYPGTAEVNGVIQFSTGGGTSGEAANQSELVGSRVFDAANGDLLVRARLKIDDTANAQIQVGFTDNESAELPFNMDGSDNLTTNATDAVGVIYDAQGTGNYFLAGVAGGSNAGPTDTGVAPANDTWNTVEVRVNDAGNAEFWIDDHFVGNLDSAVGTGTNLAPFVSFTDDNTASRTGRCDYVMAAQDRAA